MKTDREQYVRPFQGLLSSEGPDIKLTEMLLFMVWSNVCISDVPTEWQPGSAKF